MGTRAHASVEDRKREEDKAGDDLAKRVQSPEVRKAFHGRIKRVVEALGGLEATARKIKAPNRSTVRAWVESEDGGNPTFSYLWRLSEASKISLDWLIRGDGGAGPVYRGQGRAQPKLEEDVAAHVRRALQEEGAISGRLLRYIPEAKAILEAAVKAARAAAVEESARRQGLYRFKALKVANRYAVNVQRADGFIAVAAGATAQSSMAYEWAGMLAAGAADPGHVVMPLSDAGVALPVLAELLTALSPAEDPSIAIVLMGESPGAFFWRMGGRTTLEGDEPDDVLAHRQEQPEARTYELAAHWCIGQRWESAPDVHLEGHTRWIWHGPMKPAASRTE